MRICVHADEWTVQWHKTYGTDDLDKYNCPCVISGCRREVDENSVLFGYYAASSGNFFPTFRDNISVPSSGLKNKKDKSLVGGLFVSLFFMRQTDV